MNGILCEREGCNEVIPIKEVGSPGKQRRFHSGACKVAVHRKKSSRRLEPIYIVMKTANVGISELQSNVLVPIEEVNFKKKKHLNMNKPVLAAPDPSFAMGSDATVLDEQHRIRNILKQRDITITAARSMVKVGMAVLQQLGASL